MPRKKRVNNNSHNEEHIHKKHELPRLEEKLIENLIELQKANTLMVEKFDKLAKHISDLLGLFEMTARSFAANPVNQISEKDKDFLEKIDKLLEQNKTIAKGLLLMEDRIRERMQGQKPLIQVARPVQQIPQQQMPQMEQIPPMQTQNQKPSDDEFQPSMTAQAKPLPKF